MIASLRNLRSRVWAHQAMGYRTNSRPPYQAPWHNQTAQITRPQAKGVVQVAWRTDRHPLWLAQTMPWAR